jgi:hypothetical protein
MDRHYQMAIVAASWVTLIGLGIAFLVPPVGSYMVLSDLKVDDSGALAAQMDKANQISDRSVLIGLGTALIGGLLLAVTLSRWFIRSAATAASTALEGKCALRN